MEEKTTVFNKIKTVIIIVLLVICVGAVLAVIDTMKTQSTISNIITVSGFILSFVAVFFFYKPIKCIFNPQKTSDKFLCVVSALLLFSLEFSGLINIVKALFSETTKMPKYWHWYIIGLVALCLTIVFNRKPKYKIEQLDNMEGHQFEYACADILRANGYKNVVVTQGSGDFGVDVLAEKNGIKYAIQCKCYSHKLDNTPIQEVIGGLVCYGCSKGAVMTNQYFTEPAKELARQNGVELWDRDVITKMLPRVKNKKAKSSSNKMKAEEIRKKLQEYLVSISRIVILFYDSKNIPLRIENIELLETEQQIAFTIQLQSESDIKEFSASVVELSKQLNVPFVHIDYPIQFPYVNMSIPYSSEFQNAVLIAKNN